MSDAIWIATAMRLPADGQNVLVKTTNGRVEHRVTFRASPAAMGERALHHGGGDVRVMAADSARAQTPTGDAHAPAN